MYMSEVLWASQNGGSKSSTMEPQNSGTRTLCEISPRPGAGPSWHTACHTIPVPGAAHLPFFSSTKPQGVDPLTKSGASTAIEGKGKLFDTGSVRSNKSLLCTDHSDADTSDPTPHHCVCLSPTTAATAPRRVCIFCCLGPAHQPASQTGRSPKPLISCQPRHWTPAPANRPSCPVENISVQVRFDTGQSRCARRNPPGA